MQGRIEVLDDKIEKAATAPTVNGLQKIERVGQPLHRQSRPNNRFDQLTSHDRPRSPASIGDELYGFVAIRRFIGKTELETRRLIDAGKLPVFRIGTLICASKSELRKWLAEVGGKSVTPPLNNRKNRGRPDPVSGSTGVPCPRTRAGLPFQERYFQKEQS
jgi:hypothetical protein